MSPPSMEPVADSSARRYVFESHAASVMDDDKAMLVPVMDYNKDAPVEEQDIVGDPLTMAPDEDAAKNEDHMDGDEGADGGYWCLWRGTRKPSNSQLLGTAFVTFMVFASVQMAFAFAANSVAMVGDSATMMVDSMTYAFNWLAERQKGVATSKFLQEESQLTAGERKIRRRTLRKTTLQWELLPPLTSVATLLAVTGLVLNRAIGNLILDANRPESEQSTPNLALMLGFSSTNLLLDVLNLFCFSKAKHLLGYSTKRNGHDHVHGNDKPSAGTRSGEELQRPPGTLDDTDQAHSSSTVVVANPERINQASTSDRCLESDNADSSTESDDGSSDANLNMCSAYTHLFADTLRSISVILAAILALAVDEVTPEVADSSAAVVVSALILCSVIPLFRGIFLTWSEWRIIVAEERNERRSVH